MWQSQGSDTFHIICSDQPRNGKTLVARLVADYLILAKRAPLIFDASFPPGGLCSYFPIRGIRVDLSTTKGQMALLDRALEQPIHDCVVDLPAHLLSKLFGLLKDFNFIEAAHENGLGVVIHFVVDRTEASLLAGRKLRAENHFDRFIVVRNEAIVPAFLDLVARARYNDLAAGGPVVIPALDKRVITAIEDTAFSFSKFVDGTAPAMTAPISKSVTPFLDYVYRQFDLLRLKPEHASAHAG